MYVNVFGDIPDYNEARNLVNNLIKRTKIQYYRHKLEYAGNKDMFGIVNSLIKPKTERLPYFVSAEECCNKLLLQSLYYTRKH